MIVVAFRNATDHPFGGPIVGCKRVLDQPAWDWSEPCVPVTEWRADWDATHFVLDGQVVPIPQDVLEAQALALARVRLRVRRDVLLRDVVDPIVSNPLRWAGMTDAQRDAWTVCRQALLDWPAVEVDPLNPTEPQIPEA